MAVPLVRAANGLDCVHWLRPPRWPRRRTPRTQAAADRSLGTQIARVSASIAAATAALIAVLLPLGWFYIGYLQEDGRLSGMINIKSQVLSGIVKANPLYWEFEAEKTQRMLMHSAEEARLDVFRINDVNGLVLVQTPAFVDEATMAPVIVRQIPFRVGSQMIGSISVTASLRPLLRETALAAMFGILLGLGVFYVFRVLPLRALRRAIDRVGFLATHDVLTDLPNRALFQETLQQVLHDHRAPGELAAVLCLDLDRFKDVNDTLGHAAGDRVLQAAAKRLRAILRPADMLARMGGDEFAIIITGLHSLDQAAKIAGRLIRSLSEPFHVDDQVAIVGCSIGIALATPQSSALRLLADADLALYQVKGEGRGGYRFYTAAMNARAQHRKRLQLELHQALAKRQLQLYYQPQVSLADQRVLGAEALLRWSHPERGWISPSDFIPLAEETGLIGQLGQWVLETACGDASRWPASVRLAINLSPAQFRQPGLAQSVADCLKAIGFDPARLELEITEGVLLHDEAFVQETLRALKSLGVSLAMDDFGTGYSSLSHLRRFPFDRIKIDRSFVCDLGQQENARAIVRAVMALGGSLGMPVIAEGVETEEQALILQREGCCAAQGFLYGRPMPNEALLPMLTPCRRSAAA
jgi:diguanylate cyclase (GGDEF)-like protein